MFFELKGNCIEEKTNRIDSIIIPKPNETTIIGMERLLDPEYVDPGYRIGTTSDARWGPFDLIKPQIIPKTLALGKSTIEVDQTRIGRIYEFIKKCSLDFRVFPQEGKIVCRSERFLKFYILTWKQNENDDKIIIELQRRQGCGLLMQRYRRAFTKYVLFENDFDADILERYDRRVPEMPMARQSPQVVTASDKEPLEIIRRCQKMIFSHSAQQQLLGLQDLLFFLSSSSVSETTVKQVVKAILWGDQNSDATPPFLDKLSEFLIGKYQCCGNQTNCTDGGAEGDRQGSMHHLALQILAFALNNSLGLESPAQKIKLNSSPWSIIFSALCRNVFHAESCPQEAALSARCLVLLDSLTPQNCVIFSLLQNPMQTLPSLIAALRFGAANNSKLHHEVRNLLEHIEQVIET